MVSQGSQSKISESFQRFYSVPSLTSSLLLTSLQPLWPLCIPQTHQAHSCLRALALDIPSTRNILLPGHGSHPLLLLIDLYLGVTFSGRASLTTLLKSVILSPLPPTVRIGISSALFSSMSCITHFYLFYHLCSLTRTLATQACVFLSVLFTAVSLDLAYNGYSVDIY